MLALLAVFAIPSRASAASSAANYAVPGGHWFTETNGVPFPTEIGFGVYDSPTAPFWSAFQRLGGVATLGYPVSSAYQANGFATQAFQKAILQWSSPAQQMQFVNVFDLLHNAGQDGYLQQRRQIPPPLPTQADAGKAWPQVRAAHEALLDGNAALRAAYFADPDPLDHFGLPMTGPVDEGNALVVRCQRAVLQLWKVAVPWATAGQVTIANGGDIAKETGLVPLDAAIPGGASAHWPNVAAGPLRVDAYEGIVQLSDAPSGFADDQLAPPSSPSDATLIRTLGLGVPLDELVIQVGGPFQAQVHPGLINADVAAYVPQVPALQATGVTLVENTIATFDTQADAQQDFAYRQARVQQYRLTPESVGQVADGAIGAMARVQRSDGAPATAYGVVYQRGNLVGDIVVYYVGASGTFDLALQLARASVAHINAAAT